MIALTRSARVRQSSPLRLVLVASLALGLSGTRLSAQTPTAIVSGAIMDETRRVLPGATVRVIQDDTGAVRQTTADQAGHYEVSSLAPAGYRIEAEFPGFRKTVRQGVTLQIDQAARIDLILTIGPLSEEVLVVASAPLLNDRTAGMGAVVDNPKVVELPLNGRDFFQLTTLVPGVVPQVEGSQNASAGGAVSVNGAREQSNNFLLDGLDNNDLSINQIVVPPGVDTVQEFKVQTSTYAAEYGRSGGGQFSFVTRSGTNDWRFSGYEFLRDAALDARNAFDDPSRDIPEFTRNQFGGTVGGPLQRQRWFVFGGYEGQRIKKGFTRATTVPPLAWRNGDFSGLLTGARDPRTGFDSGQLFDPRTFMPIPGNKIPRESMSAAGLALSGFYPLPDDTGAVGPSVATVAPVGRTDVDQFVVKVDRVGGRKQWLARYSLAGESRFNPFDPFVDTTNVPGFGSYNHNRGQSLVTGLTHVLGDRALYDLRLGFNRFRGATVQEHQGEDVTGMLGIAGVAANPLQHGRPGVVLGILDPLSEPYNTPQERRSTTMQVNGSLSWLHGRHSFKAGADIRRTNLDFFLDLFARGSFTFVGLSGNPFADLLMGVPFVSLRQNPQADSVTSLRTIALAAFWQDNWQVRPNLTLDFGVRYELNQPPYETRNRFSVPDLANGGFINVGTGGVPRAGYHADRNNIAPRIGAAWMPFGGTKTVVRAGYGIYGDIGILNLNTLPRFNPPHFSFDVVVGPRRLEDAFGAGAAPFSLVNTVDPNYRDAYYHQFSGGVQHEFRRDWLIEAAYVGSRGRNLPVFIDVNQGPAGGPPLANPAFGPVIEAVSKGHSDYNAAQLRLERRFVRGFSLLGSYTWSASRDVGSALFGVNATSIVPQNSSDLEGEAGPSDFDTPHRLAVSAIWQLPVGPGHGVLNDGGIGSRLLGGWELATILALQSGRPYTVYYGPSVNYSGTSNGSNGGPGRDRPNRAGNPAVANPTRTRWFDPGAFAPAINAFGNAGRNSLRGNAFENLDLGIYRKFPIGATSLQVRVEVFNLLNAVHYFLPVSDLTNAAAGQVLGAGDARQVQLGFKLQF